MDMACGPQDMVCGPEKIECGVSNTISYGPYTMSYGPYTMSMQLHVTSPQKQCARSAQGGLGSCACWAGGLCQHDDFEIYRTIILFTENGKMTTSLTWGSASPLPKHPCFSGNRSWTPAP